MLNGLLNACGMCDLIAGQANYSMGEAVHTGVTMIADGTEEAELRLSVALTVDSGIGVVRHAQAGYQAAKDVANGDGPYRRVHQGPAVVDPDGDLRAAEHEGVRPARRPHMTTQESRPRADLVIAGAREVLTCKGDAPYDLGVIPDGWLAVSGESIAAVGSRAAVEAAVDCSGADVIDAAGCVVAPGFVDSHTHLVFAGSRVDEYAAKMTESDPDVLRRRGIETGVLATVARTRAATLDELVNEAGARLRSMLRAGTTTVESKSGYGLSTAAELKLLRVNRALAEATPVDVLSTFLGAHGFPPDAPREVYLRTVVDEMTPLVAEEGLAEFADVWCDDGYYTAEELAAPP